MISVSLLVVCRHSCSQQGVFYLHHCHLIKTLCNLFKLAHLREVSQLVVWELRLHHRATVADFVHKTKAFGFLAKHNIGTEDLIKLFFVELALTMLVHVFAERDEDLRLHRFDRLDKLW